MATTYTYYTDGAGLVWRLSVSSSGLLVSEAVGGIPVVPSSPSYDYFTDSTGATWKVGINSSGLLTSTSVSTTPNNTYTAANALSLISPFIKGIPITAISAQICDLVAKEMYEELPWAPSLLPLSLVTLVDGTQDYTAPVDLYRLVRARILRTDTTPDEYRELDVFQSLDLDLTKRAYTAVTAVSYEQASASLRLTSAVQVPTGTTLFLVGEYQPHPTKITSTTQTLWFPDIYFPVFVEGLLYWGYKLSDDPRYADQYKLFRTKLAKMRDAEGYNADFPLFPTTAFDTGRDTSGSIF